MLPLCQARVGLFIKFRVAVCFHSSTYNFTSENFNFSRFCRTAGFEAFQLTLGATSIETLSALTVLRKSHALLNPSAWGHLNPSSYCDVGRLFYGVFK